MPKTVWQLDPEGVLIGAATAWDHPFREDEFLLPALCIEEEPPALLDGERAVWRDGGWIVEKLPAKPTPALPEPEPVVAGLWPLQLRKALRAVGAKAAFEAYVANLPEEQREEWEFALRFPRDHALLNDGWAAIGRTPAALDDLFALGATL
ncbi:hypothetical protein [Xanthobacter versatilis]|uniref:hypothetical protein n=1 Tax=Xanthobacter autotrophicus (strain ATCC BAA-1158 / Py2) TaxID=78245 RepID=UPI00372C99D5